MRKVGIDLHTLLSLSTPMSSFAPSDEGNNKEKKSKKEKKERVSAKDRRARKEAEKSDKDNATSDINIQDLSILNGGGKLTEEQKRVATFRSVTGVLTSSPEMRDVKFDSFSLMVGGNQLVTDCHVEVSDLVALNDGAIMKLMQYPITAQSGLSLRPHWVERVGQVQCTGRSGPTRGTPSFAHRHLPSARGGSCQRPVGSRSCDCAHCGGGTAAGGDQ